MDHQMQCQIPDCLGWHPGTAVVDGVELATVFCQHHAELRCATAWALNPCERFEAKTGRACGCPPGEPWAVCRAIRAHYLPLALAAPLSSGPELSALRELALAEGVAPAATIPGATATVRAPTGRSVPPAGHHAPMASSHGTRPRRTGLTTA